jgi:hypothetical protein
MTLLGRGEHWKPFTKPVRLPLVQHGRHWLA